VKTVLTACTNTTQSWGLEMFWVILWRQCLLPVQTLCWAEVWKCSGLFCEDSPYCLYKRGLEMFWVLWRQWLLPVQTLRTAEVWKRSGLFCEDSAYCLCKHYMQSWGLEMFWVILWRQCLMFVQTVCTAEAWKCSGLFCEDSAYCLYKHYTELRYGNVLGYSVNTVLTVRRNRMQSWGLEMFWVTLWRQCLLLVQTLCRDEVWECSGLFCEDSAYCLYKHYAELRSGSFLCYSVETVLTACVNTMHSWGLEIFWVVLWRQCLLLVRTLCRDEVWKCSGLFCEESAYCL